MELGRIIKTVSMEKKRAILGKIAKLDSFYAQKIGKDTKI